MDKAETFRRLTCTESVRQDLRGRSVRAGVYMAMAGGVDFVTRLGSTAILARLILPEYFGLFVMATAVTAIADQFRDLGLSSAIVQRKDLQHQEVTNLFWINLAASVFIALVVCATSPLVSMFYRDPRLTSIACVLSLNFICSGLMVQHQALLTRQMKLGSTSTIRVLSSVGSSLLAILLAWWGFGVWAFVWREIARTAFIAIGMWVCFPWVPGLPSRQTDVRDMLRFGSHLTGANIVGTISASVDRFLLGRFFGPAPVAMYRQAYMLILASMDQLFSPINLVSQPGLALLQTDDDRYRRFYRKVLLGVCIVTMPLSLFIAVYSTEITAFVLGKKWGDSAPILMILSLGSFIRWAVTTSGLVLTTRGRSGPLLMLSVMTSVTTILLMCIGVFWGIVGVALADLAANYLLIAPRLHYSFKDSPVTVAQFFSTIARPAAASIVLALTLVMTRPLLPDLSPFGSLMVGALIAVPVFVAAWIAMPGGKAELSGLISDLRAALQKRSGHARSDEVEA